MASISRSGKGYLLQFTEGRKRFTVRLGAMERGTADEVRRRVESILGARRASTGVGAETAAWLGRISATLHARLVAAGLAQPRGASQLGPFLDAYRLRRTDVTDWTRKTMKVAAGRLTAFFGVDADMRSIGEGDVDRWVVWMKTAPQGYAPATIGRTIVRARQFFNSAKRDGLVEGNPFASVRAPSQVNKARGHFIDRATAAKVIEACPGWRERLVFALCRYGGLRCPSEHAVLRWEDVLWDAGKFLVDSPKTGPRWVPIFPELRPFLDEAWAAEGNDVLVLGDLPPAPVLRRSLLRTVKRAGLVPWPRLFHNLRASRQTELTNHYPAHVVCAWLGNSEAVARDHYLQVTDQHFASAAKCAASDFDRPAPVEHGRQ